MDSGRAQRIVLVAWLGLTALQVANQATQSFNAKSTGLMSFMPQPRKLLAGAIIFTGLSGLAEFAPSLAVALAAGTDLAIALGPVVSGVQTPSFVPGALSNLAADIGQIA